MRLSLSWVSAFFRPLTVCKPQDCDYHGLILAVEKRGIVPRRIYNGPFMGSMNMPGVSLSLLNLTNVAADCGFTSVDHLLELLDAPHNTPAWPATQNIYPVPQSLASRKRADMFTEVEKEEKIVHTGGEKLVGRSQVGIFHSGIQEADGERIRSDSICADTVLQSTQSHSGRL